jgi:hypothetical protein
VPFTFHHGMRVLKALKNNKWNFTGGQLGMENTHRFH